MYKMYTYIHLILYYILHLQSIILMDAKDFYHNN